MRSVDSTVHALQLHACRRPDIKPAAIARTSLYPMIFSVMYKTIKNESKDNCPSVPSHSKLMLMECYKKESMLTSVLCYCKKGIFVCPPAQVTVISKQVPFLFVMQVEIHMQSNRDCSTPCKSLLVLPCQQQLRQPTQSEVGQHSSR